jgi:hypothetical protein
LCRLKVGAIALSVLDQAAHEGDHELVAPLLKVRGIARIGIEAGRQEGEIRVGEMPDRGFGRHDGDGLVDRCAIFGFKGGVASSNCR